MEGHCLKNDWWITSSNTLIHSWKFSRTFQHQTDTRNARLARHPLSLWKYLMRRFHVKSRIVTILYFAMLCGVEKQKTRAMFANEFCVRVHTPLSVCIVTCYCVMIVRAQITVNPRNMWGYITQLANGRVWQIGKRSHRSFRKLQKIVKSAGTSIFYTKSCLERAIHTPIVTCVVTVQKQCAIHNL